MNRNDIAKAIVEDLLYNDALGEHNSLMILLPFLNMFRISF